MRRLLCLAALIAMVPASALAGTGKMPTAPAPRYLQHAPLSDAELQDQRGGFVIDGVSVSLGAQLNTYLNGELVLATTVNWTASSAASNTMASAALTPAEQAMLQSAIVSGSTLGATTSGSQVYVANGGQTALYQSALNGLQNVLVNTANGVKASQTINATIGLTGYSRFSGANLASTLGQTLGNAVGLAGIH